MTQHEKKQAQSQSSQTQAQTQTAGVSTYRPASHNLANIKVSGKDSTSYRRSQAAHPFYEADDQD
jgi:hypothetical protein